MNILLCADVSARRVIGGAERVLYEQATRLAQRGHRIHILTRRYPYHTTLRESFESVAEWRYEVNRNNPARFLATTFKNSRRCLRKLLGEFHFDCVNAYQPIGAYAILNEIKKNKIPMVYTCFSLSFEEYISRNHMDRVVGSPLNLFNIWLRKHLEKKIMQAAEKIIVLSKYTRHSIVNTYRLNGKSIQVVPAGVDLDKFHPDTDKPSIRANLAIPAGRFVLFTVRNLVPRMGLENLIQAVALAKNEIPGLLLIIGGEGPLADSLKESAKQAGTQGQIRWEGFIPEKMLSSYYQAADVFILPTKELEGFGMITLEALASGLPVLGTPVGGTLEILGRFDKKFIFRDTTAEAMAESIVRHHHCIRSDPRMSDTLPKKCRAFAENNYNWDLNIQTVEEILHQTTQKIQLATN